MSPLCFITLLYGICTHWINLGNLIAYVVVVVNLIYYHLAGQWPFRDKSSSVASLHVSDSSRCNHFQLLIHFLNVVIVTALCRVCNGLERRPLDALFTRCLLMEGLGSNFGRSFIFTFSLTYSKAS